MPPSFVWLGLAVAISVACFSIHAEVLTDFHFCKNDEKGDYHVNFSPLYASAGTTWLMNINNPRNVNLTDNNNN